MLPDTGERYLSTPLFADISTDMTEAELAISRSTPNYRFDVPLAGAPAAATATDDAAHAFVRDVVADAAQPVVLFALEWCEFCWAVRKLFARFGVPYRAVDLDAVALQQDRRGEAIRAALTAKTGIATIPQVFVAGALVGGATDVIAGWKQGSLQQQLTAASVPFTTSSVDPYSFLPTWLQPR
jgi:cysteine synthase A